VKIHDSDLEGNGELKLVNNINGEWEYWI